ncbi:TPA: hypothetical protein N0F65_003283 [Lagenidium giganteum]|uniref:Transmembrane protein 135 N-terminal domain-containing protein n=1 Tax=Lagenidium giganteum TaxID=4803 RepID=A0AAV2YVY9_9STRA|nr:TPA: hypothetical protein N0F65_003283 [Lagenidium giganteum]
MEDTSPRTAHSNDEDDNDNDGSAASAQGVIDGPSRPNASAGSDGRCELSREAKRKLWRDLLDALQLGTANFLLVYNTRAGIGVLLRIFRLLQRRNFGGVVDLKQLLDEKHLSFRVDAVSLGLFVGWFTGSYRALRALLPVLLRRSLRTKPDVTNAVSSLTAGAVAATALLFVDAKRRRSIALYAFTRALQCAYNMAKRRNYWHFWGSTWGHGDSLLFALSSAQVMYAFIMRPATLPSEYFRFIQKTGPVATDVMDLVRAGNRQLPVETAKLQRFLDKHNLIHRVTVPVGADGAAPVIPCTLIHYDTPSCSVGAFHTFTRAFKRTFPLYLSLFIVPSVVIHFNKFIAKPVSSLSRAVLGATRSNTFLASFVTTYAMVICAQRRVTSHDHRVIYYLAGLVASISILMEPKSRRSELALYVFPRAVDSLFMILRDRRIFAGVKHGEVLLYSFSMSIMMFCYEHEKDSFPSFLSGIMKRFLQTPRDKRRAYLLYKQEKHKQQQQLDAAANASTAIAVPASALAPAPVPAPAPASQ